MAVAFMATLIGVDSAQNVIERKTKRIAVSIQILKLGARNFLNNLVFPATTSQQQTTSKHVTDTHSRTRTFVKSGKQQQSSQKQQHDDKDEKRPKRSTIFDSLKKSSHSKSE
jgi:hypothetical protein